MRSIPAKTVEHCRSVHDVRHQAAMRHSTGEGDAFRQLARLSQERERLERRLRIWGSQKERTEAQIAAVQREQERFVKSLEPLIRHEVAEVQAPPTPFEPIPFERLGGSL